MKKKKGGGGGANWMDTYGDMVTLLLCFFVLLYSMSTISEEKWRAIVTSFNPFAQEVPTATDGNGGPVADPVLGETGVNEPNSDKIAQETIDDMIKGLYAMMQQMVASEGLASSISVELDGGKIYVTFSDQVFFYPDEYRLLPGAEDILLELCGILDEGKDAIEEIRVQGHTAQGNPNYRNDPENDRFLASDRAANVVLFLQQNSSIHPARLVSEGWGQWHPIASNKTEDTKRFNRRVEMIISGRDLDLESAGKAIQTYITQDDADMGIED